MIPIRHYRATIFYNDEESLNYLLSNFLAFADISKSIKTRKSATSISYETDTIQVNCLKGLCENVKGGRADYIAVQEELTWRDDWNKMKDCILMPMLAGQLFPIDVQIFDSYLVKENS